MATSTEATARPKQKPLPAPNSDFYQLVETLHPDELAMVKQVRAFMETKVAPIITKYWNDDAFPFELLPAFKELNIGGLGMQGYGCRGGKRAAARSGRDGDVARRLLDRDLLRRPQRPGDGFDLPRRIGRAEADVAAGSPASPQPLVAHSRGRSVCPPAWYARPFHEAPAPE
jgi:Acyl-CoA dehydrogenase, N-terminal domain